MPGVAKAAFDARQHAFPASRGAARGGLFQPRIATIITTKKNALATSALPELNHATERAGERRSDGARDVEGDRAQRDRARHIGARRRDR